MQLTRKSTELNPALKRGVQKVDSINLVTLSAESKSEGVKPIEDTDIRCFTLSKENRARLVKLLNKYH